MDTSERGYVALVVTLLLITIGCIGALTYYTRRPPPVAQPAPPAAAPVRVDEAAVRLRDVAQGAVVTHDFLLTNTSKHEIRLAVAALSSASLEASIHPTSIRPREEARVSVVLDVADAANFDAVAQISCRRVDYRNSTPSLVPLRIAGNVAAGQGLIPSAIRFGEVRRGEGSHTREFQMTFPEDANVNVLEVEKPSSEQGLTIHIDRQPEMKLGKAIYSGTVVLDADAAQLGVEQIDQAVRIVVVRDTTSTNFRLHIFGKVIAKLRVTPNSLFWSRGKADTPLQVTLDAVGGQPIEIQNVTTDRPELLQWTIRDNGTSTPTLEIVCSPPDNETGAIRSTITIHAAYGGSKETVTLPVVIL